MNADALESQHALALRPGMLLAERFRLVSSVRGTSPFAFSYHAEEEATGDAVIIKEFFPRSLVSREANGLSLRPHSPECERDFLRALHRFALEGAVLAESSQPNLVRVRSVIEANATAYLVMERHESQPLAGYLRSAGGRIGSTEAARLIQHLLSALQVLHTESIIHRDISPRSVHIGADGSALLLEFSARRHLPVHATDLAVGFAAFEQYGMRDIGPWTDVYAVSALLHYMLTGTTPPSALDRAAGETVMLPLSAVPGVSPGLARIAVKGMALLPQQRPHAVSELRRQLESALAESTSAAQRTPLSATASELGALEDAATSEFALNEPMRLAAGGMVVPGEEGGIGLLRILGSAASALRRSMTRSVPVANETSMDVTAELPSARAGVAPSFPSATVFEGPAPGQAFATGAVRELDLAAEIASTADAIEMHAAFARETTRRRYGIAAAAALVLVAGSSLVLLARNVRASGVKAPEVTVPVAPAIVTPVVTPAPADPTVSLEGGALLQSVERSSARTATDSPAQVTKRVLAQTHAASTPARVAAPQPSGASREAVLPAGPLPNVNIAVSGSAPDLKIVPPESLVDSRTRLTNGEDQVEQGDYVIARKTFRSAIMQLDSVAARYPESQAVRSLKRDIEQADARAAQACTAENEMRQRRGEKARACQ